MVLKTNTIKKKKTQKSEPAQNPLDLHCEKVTLFCHSWPDRDFFSGSKEYIHYAS